MRAIDRVPWMARERIGSETDTAFTRFSLFIACALFVWLSGFMVIIPLDYDEAVFGIVADGMLDGRWPYRDLFDHKPPLIYAWYVPYGMTNEILVQRLFALALIVASVGVMGRIARAWLSERQSRLAVISYAGMLANPFLAAGTSIETFMLLPIAAALIASGPVLAGALFSVAFMTKPTALFLAPLLVARWGWSSWRCGVGFAAAASVVAAVFLPIASDLWLANVSFNREFSEVQTDNLGTLGRSVETALAVQPQAVLGALPLWIAAVAGAFRLRRVDSRVGLWLVCAVVAVKANAFAGGEEYAHYHTLLVPPAALAAAVGLEYTISRPSYRWAYGAALAVSASLILISTSILARDGEHDELEVAIRQTTGELYTVAAPPQLYVATGRQPQRRFFYANPILIRDDWREATRLGLLRCPPDVLVVNPHPHPELDWLDQLSPVYDQRRTFDDLVLLTDPIRACERSLP